MACSVADGIWGEYVLTLAPQAGREMVRYAMLHALGFPARPGTVPDNDVVCVALNSAANNTVAQTGLTCGLRNIGQKNA